MFDTWSDLIKIFVQYIQDFTDALSYALSSYLNFDIATFNINLVLFSDTPIITITLYHLINLIIFYIVFKWFIKTLIDIVLLPIRYLRRFSNPREVVRKWENS